MDALRGGTKCHAVLCIICPTKLLTFDLDPFTLPDFYTRGVFVPQQQKNLDGYVGFANLPNQVYRKSVKRGFEFTLMVVGE